MKSASSFHSPIQCSEPVGKVAFITENVNILAILKENKGSFLITIQKQPGWFGLHLFTGFV